MNIPSWHIADTNNTSHEYDAPKLFSDIIRTLETTLNSYKRPPTFLKKIHLTLGWISPYSQLDASFEKNIQELLTLLRNPESWLTKMNPIEFKTRYLDPLFTPEWLRQSSEINICHQLLEHYYTINPTEKKIEEIRKERKEIAKQNQENIHAILNKKYFIDT